MPATAPPPPEMRVTSFDRATAMLISAIIGLGLFVAAAFALYLSLRPAEIQRLVPIELSADSGGSEDGAVDETLRVESDAAPQPDAAPVEVDSDQTELAETLDTLTELADQANQMVPDQAGETALSSGVVGSADGTGLPALGSGPGSGGTPRDQRWLINFADNSSLDVYAKQLDFFGIELGAVFPEGRLVYLSGMSGPAPKARNATTGKGEDRLYMSWQGGARKIADRKLFAKAGIDATAAEILHFYPKKTENQLAVLEAQATTREVEEIRRTYFDVIDQSGGYAFKVTNQIFR